MTNDNVRYPVPGEDRFEENELDFIEGNDLARLAEEDILPLHGSDLCMSFDQYDVRYLWKREGGKTGGKSTLGACQKPSGVLRYFAGCDFVIWVAADHTRGFTYHQMRALVFHELLHVGETDKGKATVYPHDFEGFEAEIRAYGFWKPDIEGFGRAVEQGKLFEMERNCGGGLEAIADLRASKSPTHKEMVSEIVSEVTREINTGAMDGDGVTVRAWVGGRADDPELVTTGKRGAD